MKSMSQTLVYNNIEIRAEGEFLNLTDMWRAAGAPNGQRPYDWKKDAAHRAFLDHVAMILNAPPEGIWKGQRGKNGGTEAHWQIGLAYAKYLSPAFHMWCNKIIRAHMEGKLVEAPATAPQQTAPRRAPSHSVPHLGRMTAREINAHINFLRELRMLTGNAVALAQYQSTALPALLGLGEDLAEPEPLPPELDGEACLRHLLSARLSPRIRLNIGQLADLARRDARTREQLGAAGVFVYPTNWTGFVAIANGHPQLQWVFSMTDWAPQWAPALLNLRGARKPPNAILFPPAKQRRAVLVPWETVQAVMGAGPS